MHMCWMRTSRSQVQVWISRRRADNNGLKYQNGGGIIKKKKKKRAQELLHRTRIPPGSSCDRWARFRKNSCRGRRSSGGNEEAESQRQRHRHNIFPDEISLWSLGGGWWIALAGSSSFLNGPEIPFTERTQRLHQKKFTHAGAWGQEAAWAETTGGILLKDERYLGCVKTTATFNGLQPLRLLLPHARSEATPKKRGWLLAATPGWGRLDLTWITKDEFLQIGMLLISR